MEFYVISESVVEDLPVDRQHDDDRRRGLTEHRAPLGEGPKLEVVLDREPDGLSGGRVSEPGRAVTDEHQGGSWESQYDVVMALKPSAPSVAVFWPVCRQGR